MATQIPVTGVTSSWRLPGTYVEVAFAQGPASGNSGTRDVLITAPMMSTGTYTANTVYRVKREAEVITGAGQGSRLHRMVRHFLKVNRTGKIYVLPYAETTGGSPAKAVTTIVVAGPASASGTWELEVCGELFTVAFVSGASADTVAAAMRDTLAAALHLPVAISGISANVTLTAKHYGKACGDGTYKPYRIRSNTPGSGITLSGVANLGTTTVGADGSTTEAAQLLTALNANTGTLYYYIVSDLGGDTTAMANIASWISNQSLPLSGKRCVAITAYNGALADGSALAAARNYERLQMLWCIATANAPDEVAAQVAGLRQKYEATDPSYNFDSYSGADWLLNPYSAQSSWPDSSDLNDAILGGMSPIAARIGDTFWVISTTTRTLDSSGSYMDMRAAESHRISSADAFATTLETAISVTLSGAKLAAHPTGADGLPDPNAILPRKVHTPFTILPTAKKVISDYVSSGQAQRESDMLESAQCVLSEDVPGRVEIGTNYYSIDLAHQATIYIAESTEA